MPNQKRRAQSSANPASPEPTPLPIYVSRVLVLLSTTSTTIPQGNATFARSQDLNVRVMWLCPLWQLLLLLLLAATGACRATVTRSALTILLMRMRRTSCLKTQALMAKATACPLRRARRSPRRRRLCSGWAERPLTRSGGKSSSCSSAPSQPLLSCASTVSWSPALASGSI